MSTQRDGQLQDDGWCFACGSHNPHGLHLTDFCFEGDHYVCNFTPQRCHQGWVGTTHGGIIATLLDEIMTRMLWEQGTDALTGELRIRYHQPAPTGHQLTIRGWTERSSGRLIVAEAQAELSSGELVAEAQAKFVQT